MTLIRSFFFFGIFELAFFFHLFFSRKVCYEGNGNSRHPAITSKINQLLQFNNFFTKLQKCRAPVKPASNQISSPSQAETSQHQFTTIYLPSVLLDGKTAGFLQIISWRLCRKIQTGNQEESRVQRSLSTDVCSHWCWSTGMYVISIKKWVPVFISQFYYNDAVWGIEWQDSAKSHMTRHN